MKLFSDYSKQGNRYKNVWKVFLRPSISWYIGKIVYGTPYMYPRNFNKNILTVRKLELTPPEQIEEKVKIYGERVRKNHKFLNFPTFARNKYLIIKIFGQYYYFGVGWPISVGSYSLGWKDKFNSPRHEWDPTFYFYFFHWQFVMWWGSPDKSYSGRYYEMILWTIEYCDGDVAKAMETWGWTDVVTKKSTWNDDYLVPFGLIKKI